MKFIFVSGGVISGLGKGIVASSIGKLIQSRGYKVSPVKIDMYINIDAGTIRPQEHGEVFVTHDGIETDQDLGHYERFLDITLSRANYITTGQVYQEVINKERSFFYNGEDVEAIPHITDEIIRRIEAAGLKNNADVVIVELGGTVGEYQNALFFEASRILKMKKPTDVLHVHVAYLPTPASIGEMKSKPVQQSVRVLNSMGIQPDFIIGRAERPIDERRKDRIALFCNIDKDEVISNPDTFSSYNVPLIFEKQSLAEKILKKLNLKPKRKNLKDWQNLIENIKNARKSLPVAIISKYSKVGDYNLSDAYISIVEAIKHAAWPQGVNPEIIWIDAEQLEKEKSLTTALKGVKGIIVPGGFGKRGVEGKIAAIQYAREKPLPFLGLCFGLQLAVVEFARNICGLKKAHSTEIDPQTKYPVIAYLPEQIKYIKHSHYGATMRLGAYPCIIEKSTLAYRLYRKTKIAERHRHRYEVNPAFHRVLKQKGLIFSGTSPDKKLVEIIEIKNHPFFIASQFHPEFQSTFKNPHPLFKGFIQACQQQK